MERIAHLITLLLAVFAATPALAQVSDDTGTARMTLIKPLSITKIKDLEFGTVAFDGVNGGSITIDPNAPAGSETIVTGGLVSYGDSHAAEFGGAAIRNIVVNIRYPRRDLTITRVGGTETLTVRDFTIEGNSKRRLAALEYFTFKIGGTLDVPAGTVEGEYEGNFEVFVQYP
ncbi:DUF4402 domain-containing protein [Sphingomicrobium flavum]|uniref:DUF4402 domain-containing protein n=1 Tax=Sphingomicrobium flavum TaxID=1229164 RepID=UPI0021ADD48A|nr:DUF4402 domain-containing protein [Sphingomicrobium flavum]